MVKVNPSAVGLVPGVIWKSKPVENALTSTWLLANALEASLKPPSVSWRLEPLKLAKPFKASWPAAPTKPDEKLRPWLIEAWLGRAKRLPLPSNNPRAAGPLSPWDAR